MLEPITYDIGRLCKENDKELTPKLINIDVKAEGIKMPFDTYRELTTLFKKSFIGDVEYKGNVFKYQILNFGKYVDLIELEDVDLYIIADSRRLIERKELQIIPKIREKVSQTQLFTSQQCFLGKCHYWFIWELITLMTH